VFAVARPARRAGVGHEPLRQLVPPSARDRPPTPQQAPRERRRREEDDHIANFAEQNLRGGNLDQDQRRADGERERRPAERVSARRQRHHKERGSDEEGKKTGHEHEENLARLKGLEQRDSGPHLGTLGEKPPEHHFEHHDRRKGSERRKHEQAGDISGYWAALARQPRQRENARDDEEHSNQQQQMSTVPAQGCRRDDRDLRRCVHALSRVEKVTDTHERRADDEARGADDDT